MRAQATLPALAISLLVLTSVVGLSLAVADGAFASADRESEQHRLAVALAERLIAADSPISVRPNVLDADEVADLDGDRLGEEFPFVEDVGVRIRLDGETIVDGGSTTDGSTIQRIVLVEERQAISVDPPTDPPYATTLPRRASRVELTFDTPPPTEVRTVRANHRVVLHDPDGLDGEFVVDLSRFETTTLEFDVEGPLPPPGLEIVYYPTNTAKAVLEVTVNG